MASFNFSTLSNVSTSSNFLKPFGIYDAKFTGATIDDVTSKDGKKYKTINLNFHCNEGDYKDTYFVPADSAESLERKEGQWGPQASAYDHFIAYMSHVMGSLNKDGWAKLCEVGAKINSFEKMAVAFVKLLESAVGAEVKLRLSGRKYNRSEENGGGIGWSATTNHFLAGINRNGEMYVSTKKGFINNVAPWNASELALKNEYDSYQPTSMASPSTGHGSEDSMFNKPSGASKDEIDDLLASL